jgi:predicted metal-dependent RNase
MTRKRDSKKRSSSRGRKKRAGARSRAKPKLELTFYGGVGEVGRSCFLLSFGQKKFLLDAGIKVGGQKGKNEVPSLPIKLMKSIDVIIVSHAHIDHSGFIPFIVKKGFRGKIFTTKPSRDVIQLLLSDAVNVSQENKQAIYDHNDVAKTLSLMEAAEFNVPLTLAKNVSLTFYNAGHILGSAMALLSFNGTNLLYSGDFSLRDSMLLPKASVPAEKIDVLLIESTYGKKEDVAPSLKTAGRQLADAVEKALKRGGKVLIPVFAVGRGQEVMLVLENYVRSGYTKPLSIFVDGMVLRANRICRHNVIYCREEIPRRILLADDDPFKSPFIKAPVSKNKSEVFKEKRSVILSTSGMLSGGPALFYLKRLAPEKKNLILFVGFQAPGTLGARILSGEREVEVRGQKLKVKAEVKRVRFSGHSDFKQLVELVELSRAENVFIVHGDAPEELAEHLRKKLKKKVFLPGQNQSFQFPVKSK